MRRRVSSEETPVFDGAQVNEAEAETVAAVSKANLSVSHPDG